MHLELKSDFLKSKYGNHIIKSKGQNWDGDKQNEFSKSNTLELHFKINFEYMCMADDQRIHFK